MERQTQRSAVVDISKGITIFLVVYLHCLRGLEYANILPKDFLLLPTDYVVYSFVMPVFFLLSGYFFPASLRKGPRDFWIGRLKTIVFPYFLWSLILGGFQLALGGTGAMNSTFRVGDLVGIFWKPIVPFWFLYALLASNILALLLKSIRPDIVVAASAIAFIAGLHQVPNVFGDIAYGFLYFSLGILVRERDWLRRVPSTWSATAVLFLGLVVASEGCRRLGLSERLQIPASLIGTAAILALSGALEKTAYTRPVATFFQLAGQCSMSIYVMHILVLGFVRTIGLRVLGFHDPLVLMPPAIALAVLAPLATQVVASRLGLHAYFGWTAPTMFARSAGPRD